MSALIENLKALHYESVELNAPPNIVRIFLRQYASNRSYRSALTHFLSVSSIVYMSIFLRAACVSIRIERRISNSIPLENQPDHVCLCNMGDANISIRARSDYSRIGRDSPPVSLFLTGFRKTWVAYYRRRTGVATGWGLVDDNGRGLSRCNRRDTGYLLVRQPYLSYLSYRLTSIKRSN